PFPVDLVEPIRHGHEGTDGRPWQHAGEAAARRRDAAGGMAAEADRTARGTGAEDRGRGPEIIRDDERIVVDEDEQIVLRLERLAEFGDVQLPAAHGRVADEADLAICAERDLPWLDGDQVAAGRADLAQLGLQRGESAAHGLLGGDHGSLLTV